MKWNSSRPWFVLGLVFGLAGLLAIAVGCGGSSDEGDGTDGSPNDASATVDPNLTVEQTLAKMRDVEGLQLLDVRTDDEWNEGHIEGAIHIPVQDLESRLDELDKGRPVLTYCAAGGRSKRALDLLDAQGFSTEGHLAPGIRGWKQNGQDVVVP